jgi:hypothetical protein
MANCIIEITWQLEKVENDCSACFYCNDIIYGNQYGYVTYVGNNKCSQPSLINLCQSCVDLIEIDGKR